ncbi:MAG: DUF4390 domain-containing protein [Burkholderiales bacterium]|nr:DUF4390 domain-containing protein [Burkholderiales bacterium]
MGIEKKQTRLEWRLWQHIGWALIRCLFALLLGASATAHAVEGIEIKEAHIESAEDGYKLAATFDLELNRGLEDAVTRGIPLYFTTEIELTRPRWYWLDEKTLRSTHTLRLSYNVLTRKYIISFAGGVQQTFNSLEEALFLVRRPSRWLIGGRGALKAGEVYNVSMRMALNLEYMSKPFQVNAINNSDWRLSSDRKNFSFKAEDK